MKKPLLLAAALGATVADWQPAQLPQAAETTVTSAHSGRSYRIQTATIGEAPPAGYPVLYLLDGDTYFLEPQASASRDLSRIIFATNLGGGEINSYVIGLPSVFA
mgnify:CR=1 FL=1